jgi:tRNA-dihydrouridine synthase
MKPETQIYFAPFQSITTSTFRKVYTQHFSGIDKLFTPYFFKIKTDEKLSAKHLRDLKNQAENGVEVVPQILSKNASEIIGFAKNCQELGFKELNWNLGCPYPQVANKKLGSGLLQYPDLLDSIQQEVLREIEIPFSIKCRLGYQSKEEIKKLIPVFNRYALSEIIIHARIGKQLYSGETDRAAFAQIVSQLNAPLTYNGDIFNEKDFVQFKNDFPEINRLMLGRGILKDPFLPAKIKGLDLPENPKAHLRIFMEELYYAYRKEKNDQLSLLSALKEYWTYLIYAFDEPTRVFRKLKKCKSFDTYEDAVYAVFEEHNLISFNQY